jgi:hypothetical protein
MTVSVERRDVYYSTLDDLLADAERLAQSKLHTVGKWSFPQILDHLARAMNASVDGFGFRAPWFVRALLAPLMRNWVLTHTMKPGFQLPPDGKALIPDENPSLPEALDRFTQAAARFKKAPKHAPHPFLGNLPPREYEMMHLRHSELHMSFVIPDETA